MALTKVTYVDGKTIITAANLNAIQDEIISQESRKAEKTATVSNVTYDETTGKFRKTINGTTSDIITADSSPTRGSKKPVQSGGVYTALAGKVPTTRTVNNKALSADISLTASDVGAVPTSRTVNGKALSANIALASGDISDDSGAGGATVKASLAILNGSLNTKLLRFESVALSSGVSSGQIARVPSSGTNSALTENSFVIEATFSNPLAILSNITVTKYAGYFTLTGTTGSSAGTVDIKMGNP